MERIEPIVAALAGLYCTWVVLTALRGGTIRYRTRIHARTTEPKTYWLVVGWFSLLALIGLTVALLQGKEYFGR